MDMNDSNLTTLAEELKKLPEMQRDVIVFRYYYRFKNDLIAKVMGINESIVEKLHQTAIDTLEKGGRLEQVEAV